MPPLTYVDLGTNPAQLASLFSSRKRVVGPSPSSVNIPTSDGASAEILPIVNYVLGTVGGTVNVSGTAFIHTTVNSLRRVTLSLETTPGTSVGSPASISMDFPVTSGTYGQSIPFDFDLITTLSGLTLYITAYCPTVGASSGDLICDANLSSATAVQVG